VSAALRAEAPDGPASRALWAEYQALLADRLDAPPADPQHVFASPESFTGPGSAWLVAYDGEDPVACGGLRALDAETGGTLWRGRVGKGPLGPPVSFMAGGRQRIALTSQRGLVVFGLPRADAGSGARAHPETVPQTPSAVEPGRLPRLEPPTSSR